MNVKSVEKNENSAAKVVLQFDKAEFEKALNMAYNKVKNDVYVQGFRRGKAPRKIVERMYGTEVFYEDAINLLFPKAWETASADLDAVGNPSIADLKVEEDGSLVLTVETGVYPEVTLGEYKGLAVEKPETAVSDEDVEAEINKLAERNSSVQTVERPAELGDTAVIDFLGLKDGVPFEGGAGDNQNLKLGSGTFVPGFEEQIVGMTAGEEKDLDVTFPENYGAEELAGQAVVFKVKLHEVKATIAPEIDDEFAKDVSETADTLEDLKKELREKLEGQKAEEAETAFKNNAIQAAMDNMTVVIPDGMVEYQLDNMMNQYAMNLQQSGFSLEQFAQMMGTTVQGLREQNRESAIANIKNTLLMEKVAEVEAVEVSDEEVEAELQKIADENEMELEKVKEMLAAEDLKAELKLQKAMKVITDSAVVKAAE